MSDRTPRDESGAAFGGVRLAEGSRIVGDAPGFLETLSPADRERVRRHGATRTFARGAIRSALRVVPPPPPETGTPQGPAMAPPASSDAASSNRDWLDPASSNPVLAFDRVGFAYDGRRVMRDVSFRVGACEIVALLGPSGCGKTTILDVIAGFLAPTEGVALLDGREIAGPGPDRGVVFQVAAVFD